MVYVLSTEFYSQIPSTVMHCESDSCETEWISTRSCSWEKSREADHEAFASGRRGSESESGHGCIFGSGSGPQLAFCRLCAFRKKKKGRVPIRKYADKGSQSSLHYNAEIFCDCISRCKDSNIQIFITIFRSGGRAWPKHTEESASL